MIRCVNLRNAEVPALVAPAELPTVTLATAERALRMRRRALSFYEARWCDELARARALGLPEDYALATIAHHGHHLAQAHAAYQLAERQAFDARKR